MRFSLPKYWHARLSSYSYHDNDTSMGAHLPFQHAGKSHQPGLLYMSCKTFQVFITGISITNSKEAIYQRKVSGDNYIQYYWVLPGSYCSVRKVQTE